MGDEKVIIGESFQYRKDLTDPILASNATDKFDIIGAHIYGTSLNDFAYQNGFNSGKELWMTEHYTTSTDDADLWPLALDVAYEIHNCMVNAQFSAYVWWYIRRSYGPIKENGRVSKRGYCMAQYSKFVRPGYYRIDVDPNPTYNVNISAYKNGEDATIVAVNRSTESKTLTFELSGGGITSMEQYVTSGTKNVAKENDVNVSGGTFTVTLDPQSVTTFTSASPMNTPQVLITAPSERIIGIGETIEIEASVTDNNDDVTLVEFFVDDDKIGQSTSTPYTISWTSEAAGEYRITAVATDTEGNSGTGGISIDVRAPQAPYGGTAHAIPGKIEFEEFDTGGQDSAYFDSTPGSETDVSFRDSEDVDIENCEDAGGGYNLGWTASGEWLEYTVDVEVAGTYSMDVRLACSETGRNLTFTIAGRTIANNLVVPATGDWQEWETVTAEDIELTSGIQILRVTIGGEDYVNMNHVTFNLVTPLDQCPDDPNKTVPGECGCGTPDIDSDNDLVYDCNDLCPNDPNKTEPGECGCGQPEGNCSDPLILTEGWNLIGCPLEISTPLDEALQSIWQYVVVVKDMNQFYNRNYPEQFSLLVQLESGKGYLIWVSNDCELTW